MRHRVAPALVAVTLATALVVMLAARPAVAQPRPSFHAGLTWSDMHLQAPYASFTDHRLVMPSVVAGWTGARGLMLEARVGRLRGEAWETWGPMDGTATFISTTALLAEARVGWASPRWVMGPARPHVALGVLAACVRDASWFETPIEYPGATYPGMTATAGIDLPVVGPVALRLQASWRRVFDGDEREGPRWELDARALEAGVLLRR